MNGVCMALGGLGMDALGSLFAAGPALGIMASAPSELGVGLGEDMKCQRALLWWQKAVAILP